MLKHNKSISLGQKQKATSSKMLLNSSPIASRSRPRKHLEAPASFHSSHVTKALPMWYGWALCVKIVVITA